ncbi:DUN1_2 [Sanghuangporus weigelae]
MNKSTHHKHLPRFKKMELIGAGNFGDVYECYDREEKRIVALKTIIHSNEVLIDRESMIINVLKDLGHHDNIIDFLEEFMIPSTDQTVFVFEYAAGGSVYARLKILKKFTEVDARDVIKGTLRGLDFLHSRRIIHRDVKPANILLRFEGLPLWPKLADFGLSSLIPDADGKVEYNNSGTLTYSPPEAFEFNKIGTKADIWPIGVIMYQLFFGHHPFDYEDLATSVVVDDIKAKVLELGYGDHTPADKLDSLFETISPDARHLMAELLRKDETIRPSAEEALKYNWIKTASRQKTFYASGLETERKRELLKISTIREREFKLKKDKFRAHQKLQLRKRHEERSSPSGHGIPPSNARDGRSSQSVATNDAPKESPKNVGQRKPDVATGKDAEPSRERSVALPIRSRTAERNSTSDSKTASERNSNHLKAPGSSSSRNNSDAGSIARSSESLASSPRIAARRHRELPRREEMTLRRERLRAAGVTGGTSRHTSTSTNPPRNTSASTNSSSYMSLNFNASSRMSTNTNPSGQK